MTTTNRERFIRVAEKRLNNTIKQLQLIGNLSEKSNYTYTDEEIEKMFEILQRHLDDAHVRFRKNNLTHKDTSFLTGK